MKILLATIIAASLSVSCSVLEGEQVSSDTGGGSTAAPPPSGNNSNGPTVYMDCDSGVESPTRSAFGEHAVWSRNVTNCDGDGRLSADTTDKNGNLYFMMNGGSGPTNTKIVKLNNNGSEQWSQVFSSDFENHTHDPWGSNRLIVDTHGNLYGITSESYNSYSPADDNKTLNSILFKVSTAGVEQWRVEDTYTTEVGYHSYYPIEVFVDSSGNFYTSRRIVVEVHDSSTHIYDRYQQTTIDKYSSGTGEKLWRKDFVSDNTYYHHSANVVFESSGGFYIKTEENVYGDDGSSIIGTEHKIAKYNNDGVELWRKSVDSESMNSLTVDGDNVYFVSTDGTTGSFFLFKYSHAGMELWKNNVPSLHGEIRLAQDGSVYFNGNYTIIKYSTAGSYLWTKSFSSDSEIPHMDSSIKLDAAGNIYRSQESEETHDNGTKTRRNTLTKYSSNGIEQWASDVIDVTVAYDHIHSGSHPFIDASGNVFVHSHVHGYTSGSTPGNFNQTVLAKYSSDGTKLWEGANNDRFHGGLTAGQNGEVYLFDNQYSNFDSMGYPMGPGTSFYLKLR